MTNYDPTAVQTAARTIAEKYSTVVETALQDRDAALRELQKETGCPQVDLIKGTGYSRETIRKALNPKIREAIQERRKQRSEQPEEG